MAIAGGRRRIRARRGPRFYGQWLGEGSLVFDIGANVGERSRMFLALGCRVVAVEPQPGCVAELRRMGDDRLVIEEVALGAEAGVAQLHVSDASTISSMADGWIERMRASGRFAGHEWRETIAVDVSTLDALIDRHGSPDFCKIDVEGFEAEVVAGLSRPLPLLSFEFTPEWSEGTERVLDRLEEIGFSEFNLSRRESLILEWPDWRSREALRGLLDTLPHYGGLFGDVYARAPLPT
jgi:FkbM family methyltransferase